MSHRILRYPVTFSHIFGYHNGHFHCKIPGCKCEEGLASTNPERNPVICRVPVTRDGVIATLVGKDKCDDPACPCHKAEKHYLELLQQSISKMVWKIAGKYANSRKNQVEDFYQKCFERIFAKLDYFDPALSQFSTWSWTVCENALNHESEKLDRIDRTFSPWESGFEPVKHRASSPLLRSDIRAAAQELCKLHPMWCDVIKVMASDNGLTARGNLNATKIARLTGRRYNDVRVFMVKTARPFFINWFNFKGGSK